LAKLPGTVGPVIGNEPAVIDETVKPRMAALNRVFTRKQFSGGNAVVLSHIAVE